MNNIFYASKPDFKDGISVEIKGQEATHISKVLRHKVGDTILVADGEGSRFDVVIREMSKQSVVGNIQKKREEPAPAARKILALGLLKKRDRLEFAVEKAVELGASEICLFNSDHSERNNSKEERLKTIILSAFKQSGRFWLPKLVLLDSLDQVFSSYANSGFVMAHEQIEISNQPKELIGSQTVLMVGPEGGFSKREVELNKEKGGEFISLGKNRLRAETAVVAFLSQYLFSN
ncbi:MAG: RsmE family RNA methyltransferase [Balneolaceae bacterium]